MVGDLDDAVLQALDGTTALVTGVRRAGEVVADLDARSFLHAGPPIEVDDLVGPMRGAVLGALVLEGQAEDVVAAERLLNTVTLRPCHDAGAVGAMAGVLSPSLPVVVARASTGAVAVAPLNEGLGQALRFGSNDPATLGRLRWMSAVAAPILDAAIAGIGGLDVTALQCEALRRGDECHNRNVAATAALLASLAPEIVRCAPSRADAIAVLKSIADNPHFFLSFSIAAGKAIADAAAARSGSGIVTAMCANGREIGIRVAGMGQRWFTCGSIVGEPKLFDGYTREDACPAMGDSFIAETVGLGAFALAAAPALSRFVGGDPTQATVLTDQLRTICRGTSTRFLIPSEGFRGTPLGIDVDAVATSGLTPLVNNGLAHVEPGRGQVGAGLTRLPLAPFQEAHRATALARSATDASVTEFSMDDG